ncbi:sensor domain-containing diguanylate cyclase [Belnapia mucosa]|nr:diguanylate cyclase [Belnapia mucosa]
MRVLGELLQRGWTTLLGLLAVLGLCALSGVVILELRADSWARASDAAMNLNRAVGQDIARTLGTLDLALQETAERLRANERGDHERLLHSPLFERSIGARNIGAVMILDAEGRALDETGQAARDTVSYADREYFRVPHDNPDSGLTISQPFRGRRTGEWRLALSRPWIRADGSLGGVVVASLKLDYFLEVFHGLDLGAGGRISLFREDGILLARMPAGRVEIGQDFSRGTAFRAIPTAREGSYRSISSRDGVERFYVFKRIESLPLILNLGLSIETIEAGWRQRALAIGGTTLALAALLLLTIGLLRRELRRRQVAETAARESEAQFRLLAENTGDLVSRIDRHGIRTYVSPSAHRILGRAPEQLLGRSANDGVHPKDMPALNTEIARLRNGSADEVTITFRTWRADGVEIWLESTLKVVRKEATGEADGVVAVSRDITERKMLERQLDRLARLDGLTGVANRRSFDEAIGREWARCMEAGMPLSVILVDVDRFKAFNDHYGHPEGDACLRVVAATVGATIRRAADLVARYGGEEFAVLLPETEMEGAHAVAERLRAEVEALALPHAGCLEEGGMVTVSVGVATIQPASCRAARGPEALIGAADRALYAAKQAGRNQVCQAPQLDPLNQMAD